MNYLAHVLLSGNNEEVVIGNFIGDYVKGKHFKKYSESIKKGILLHRSIDLYTDRNKTVKKSKSLLKKKYGKYSGIIIDIFYDHFLAKNWHKFSSHSLKDFTQNLHKILKKYFEILPDEVKKFVPSFITRDWINTYKSIDGIEMVLKRMSSVTSLPDETDYAIIILRENYTDIENDFLNYFPGLAEYVSGKYGISLSIIR
ncbi:MAG: acyl carrier protein phosphodiesterase [Bacteroidales bacterium]|nr:MAG: acyl carrier protein phosphodiesterase [Bacteroidales bacterium]